MLILTRKIGQETYIGKDIKVKIIDIYYDYMKNSYCVQIGLDAPKEISIVREEAHIKFN